MEELLGDSKYFVIRPQVHNAIRFNIDMTSTSANTPPQAQATNILSLMFPNKWLKRKPDLTLLTENLSSVQEYSATDSAFANEDYLKIDFISLLPQEISKMILCYLDDPSINLVCKRWNVLSADWEVWQSMYNRKYSMTPVQKANWKSQKQDWCQLFKQKTILMENWQSGNIITKDITGHSDSVYCLQYDKVKMISGSRDRTIKYWDVVTFACYKTLYGHQGSVLCLQFNDNIIASGSSDCSIILWDIESGVILNKLHGHSLPVLDIRLSGERLISCSKDCSIKIWDISSGRLIRKLEGHNAAVNAIHSHENILVSASGDNLVKMWNIDNGKLIREFKGHERGLACVQFDGKTVVSGSSDRTIKFWNAETGENTLTLKEHTDLVRTLHFNNDHLVSGSYDQTMKVWDMKTGKLLLDLRDAHSSWIFHLQIDGTKIISASQDRKIIVWNFAKGVDPNSINDFVE